MKISILGFNLYFIYSKTGKISRVLSH